MFAFCPSRCPGNKGKHAGVTPQGLGGLKQVELKNALGVNDHVPSDAAECASLNELGVKTLGFICETAGFSGQSGAESLDMSPLS